VTDANEKMADRKLRDGTRKDYSALANGTNRSSDEEQGRRETDGDEFSDGARLLIEQQGISTSIEQAEERLKLLKLEAMEMEKEERTRKIEIETQEMEMAMQRMKMKKNDKTTIASLRKMNDVVEEVDKLMDKNLKRKVKRRSKKESSSESDSQSSSSTESSTSCSESEEERHKKKEKKRRKKKNGRGKKGSRKHKSGKSKRITSYVKNPQKWPHSHLSLHFVDKDKCYEDLSIAEFCAGYATILEVCSSANRMHRVAHFKELMYLATKYQWKCVLNFHGACLLEIERGHMKWGDSFLNLQTTTLAGGILTDNSRDCWEATSGGRRNTREFGPITFCKSYQRGVCIEENDHVGDFNGVERLLRHICGRCWLETRKKASHSENSELCPLKGL
jgi:hypothetical protein